MIKYYKNGLPWSNGLGKDVTDCITAKDVMKKANLDWTVKKCELVAKMPFSLNGNNTITEIDELNGAFKYNGNIYRGVPEEYATYRTDKNIPLGLVKSKYEIVQNIDAFNFFDDAIGIDKCNWESAGFLHQGQKIFVTAKLKLTTSIKANNTEDNIDNYLVFINSHDGSTSLTIMFTPIRVFCTNMLNAGLNKSESYIKIRHTESVKGKLETGVEILKIAAKKANESKELYQALQSIKMTDEEVIKYLVNLNLTNDEHMALLDYDKTLGYKRLLNKDYATLERTGISIRKANTIQNMFDYYMNGIAQQEIIGSAWGAYNAVTGYYSNVANLEGQKRMESLLYGNAQNIMQKAINNAYNILKAA